MTLMDSNLRPFNVDFNLGTGECSLGRDRENKEAVEAQLFLIFHSNHESITINVQERYRGAKSRNFFPQLESFSPDFFSDVF